MSDMDDDLPLTPDGLSDMDVIFGKPIDAEKSARDLNQNVGRRGTYDMDANELGEFQVFPLTPRADDPERRTFRLVGRVRGSFGGQEEVARVAVLLSPDARRKRNFETGEEIEGKHDTAYVRWLEAVQAYRDVWGETPKDERAVIGFLRTGPLRYVLSPIGGELRVVRITGKRRGGRLG